MSNQPTTWLVIQPLWGVYLVTQGEGGALLGDFPNERVARQFVAAIQTLKPSPSNRKDLTQ